MSDPAFTASPSSRAYEALRAAVLRGDVPPEAPLKPQEIAGDLGVSLAVVRESLLRLVGEGLAERLPNRGFAVPAAGSERWQQLGEARRVIEPAMLRLAIARGDVAWEARVRAAHHVLAATPARGGAKGTEISGAWNDAHRGFHRTLLDACGNDFLLAEFDRLWTIGELTRRWAADIGPQRDYLGEHRALEELTLDRDADGAAAALAAHLERTTVTLSASS